MKKYKILTEDLRFTNEWRKSCDIFNGLPNRNKIVDYSLKNMSPHNYLGAVVGSAVMFHLIRLGISVDSVGEKDLNILANTLLTNYEHEDRDNGDILSKRLG